MTILLFVALIILALTILVTIHELGHFGAAKMFGIRVETFSIFFPPKLVGFKKGDTTYQIGSIPLGGFVKISGMIDESLDKENIDAPIQPWEFRAKPYWQRLIVMVAGVVMNVILACVIMVLVKFSYGDLTIKMDKLKWGIFVPENSLAYDLGFRTGDKVMAFKDEDLANFQDISKMEYILDDEGYYVVEREGKIVQVPIPENFLEIVQSERDKKDKGKSFYISPDGPPILVVGDSTDSTLSYQAGLRNGDKITMIDSTEIEIFSQISGYLKDKPLTEVDITVLRDHEKLTFENVKTDSSGKIQVGLDRTIFIDTIDYSFGQSIPVGFKAAFNPLIVQFLAFKNMFTGKLDPTKSVQGPVGIAKSMGESFLLGGWQSFWEMTAFLSMILAFMNILPIPALDGGHILILLIEMVIGRELPTTIKLRIQQVGMIVLLALMAVIIILDITRL